MVGNEIIVNPGIAGPRGRLETGIISGTDKPGTCMQLKAATAAVNGNFTFEAFNQNFDGDAAPVIVLLEDSDRGKIYSDAYVTGTLCKLYWPVVGDELNMLVDASLGAIAIGDKFQIDDSTGQLVAATAYVADYATPGLDTEAEVIVAVNLLKNKPALTFQALEAVSDPSADVWVHCRCIRNC